MPDYGFNPAYAPQPTPTKRREGPSLLESLFTPPSDEEIAFRQGKPLAEVQAESQRRAKIENPALGVLPTIEASTANTPGTRNYVEKQDDPRPIKDRFNSLGGSLEHELPETLIGRPVGASTSLPEAPKPAKSSIRAYKDAQGRTVFSNDPQGQSEAGHKETSYDLATAALRPEGRQAGGVSSPVARDDSGRTTMVPDPGVRFQRQQELEDLGHAAIVQQLKQQGQTPEQGVQQTLGMAEIIGKQLVPDPPDLQAYVDANTAVLMKANPTADPAAIRATVVQRAQQKLAQARQQAFEDHFSMLQYSGPVLAGAGNLKRGDAASILGQM